MKTLAGLSLVLALTLVAGGCSKDHGDVMDDMTSEMSSLSDVLSKVKDEATAKAALSDVESIAGNLGDLTKTLEDMGEPTEAEAKDLMQKGMASLEASQKMVQQIMRVRGIPEAWAVLKDALDKIGK